MDCLYGEEKEKREEVVYKFFQQFASVDKEENTKRRTGISLLIEYLVQWILQIPILCK